MACYDERFKHNLDQLEQKAKQMKIKTLFVNILETK